MTICKILSVLLVLCMLAACSFGEPEYTTGVADTLSGDTSGSVETETVQPTDTATGTTTPSENEAATGATPGKPASSGGITGGSSHTQGGSASGEAEPTVPVDTQIGTTPPPTPTTEPTTPVEEPTEATTAPQATEVTVPEATAPQGNIELPDDVWE